MVLFVAVAALMSCQKENRPLTMTAAIKKVDKVIRRYPDRDWYASKETIAPGTILQYSRWGKHWDDPELMHEYVSPDYCAWLVMIGENQSLDAAPDECLHLFIDADSGEYLEVWLKGQAIVEWGSTPYSRASGQQDGQ